MYINFSLNFSGTSLVKTSSLGGTGSLQLVTRGVSQPTVTIRPAVASTAATGSTPVPIIRLTPGKQTFFLGQSLVFASAYLTVNFLFSVPLLVNIYYS